MWSTDGSASLGVGRGVTDIIKLMLLGLLQAVVGGQGVLRLFFVFKRN